MKLILAIVLFASIQRNGREFWVLKYQCESGLEPEVCEMDEPALKSFPGKSDAIAWAESNYTFYPVSLQHGDKSFHCFSTYIDTEDPDPITVFRKVVACDKKIIP
jgi:hypothetical protein